ncbi:hypothetical protein M408DRAFT_177572 [Serendipita vermifera MAFF 305830]|uniref:Phospholipid/glycerol acyltransferase domain-containing protein n=1 Tax=Serendipita vermifera MAFF 305830 TaxID=933852 RepID=A0A0C3B5M6_SERVB|nr:hypothetical protein M408DRAFT_177572 [Serendipita vermifera MAFF 305830]
MCLIVLAEHFLLQTVALLLYPIPPLYRWVSWLFTAINCRAILALAGYGLIDVEMTSKKKGRAGRLDEKWSPKAGDVIVSNWCSWVELLWLAFRFDPIFVLPVAPTPQANQTDDSGTPGRRTGTGSAAIAINKSGSMQRMPITGFHEVSLWKMLSSLGQTPSTNGLPLEGAKSLESIRRNATRPVVVFPECTTSNGRGLLRYADVFDPSTVVPVKAFKVFIMCVRYDSPTHWRPTPTCSIPNSLPIPIPEPLVHLMSIPLEPAPVTIRLLPPSESPSSGAFMTSDIFAAGGVTDTLTEACSVLTTHVGKLKRTNQGWEEKTSFLSFYYSKKWSRL